MPQVSARCPKKIRVPLTRTLKSCALANYQMLIANCYQLLLQRGAAVLTYARVAVAVFLMAHPHGTRAGAAHQHYIADGNRALLFGNAALDVLLRDRKSTRLNSSHLGI